jgi:hypothetical protein
VETVKEMRLEAVKAMALEAVRATDSKEKTA